MPNFKAHCTINRQRTGFDFAELHQWIDNSPEARFLGSDHRVVRHAYNREDMEYIRQFWDQKMGAGWGDKAIVEWLFHVAVDNLSTAFMFARERYGPKAYNLLHVGIQDSGFVHIACESVRDPELRGMFPDDAF